MSAGEGMREGSEGVAAFPRRQHLNPANTASPTPACFPLSLPCIPPCLPACPPSLPACLPACLPARLLSPSIRHPLLSPPQVPDNHPEL